MNATAEAMMKVTYRETADTLRDRLHHRLEGAARLRCVEHGEPVVAVTIHGRENGWFDSVWTTCCTALETEAAAILKTRC